MFDDDVAPAVGPAKRFHLIGQCFPKRFTLLAPMSGEQAKQGQGMIARGCVCFPWVKPQHRNIKPPCCHLGPVQGAVHPLVKVHC